MDSQESPPVHHHHPPPPQYLQSLPPHHPHHHPHHNQHVHATMVAPQPPLPTPPPQSHQQEQPNSYIFQQQPQFPFNSISGQNPIPKSNLDYSDGSSSAAAAAAAAAVAVPSEPAKKRRGRPRKYSPADGNIGLGLSPTPIAQITSASVVGPTDSGAGVNGAAAAAAAAASENPSKKGRGRPPGSGKKQQQDALGAVGFGFTPHLLTVNIGEDVVSKVMAFSQQGPRAVLILSASGIVCNVTLRQPAMGGSTVSYEGRFEIISISGSFMLSDSNGSRSRTGGLSVALAGPDGRVLGGGVAGMLIAATPIEVIVGSFIADKEKPKSPVPSPTPPPNMVNFGTPAANDATSPSVGASSNSSDGNGGSPLSHEQGHFGDVSQQMHDLPTAYWG